MPKTACINHTSGKRDKLAQELASAKKEAEEQRATAAALMAARDRVSDSERE